MSPFSGKLEPVVRNLTQGHLAHGMRQGLIKREVTAEKVTYEIILGVDISYHWVKLVQHNQVQELPQEGGHGGV